jgi:hypothetical protein
MQKCRNAENHFNAEDAEDAEERRGTQRNAETQRTSHEEILSRNAPGFVYHGRSGGFSWFPERPS